MPRLTQVINNIFKWASAFYLHEFYNETESVALWQKVMKQEIITKTHKSLKDNEG